MNGEAGVAEGRAWLFPEANLNTDLMRPAAAFHLPMEEQTKLVFKANRPGWADLVEPGDVIVCGKNFGTGSSRPASQVLRALGIGAVIAESINDLFYRNCVNFALPAIEYPGILAKVKEGDRLRIDVRSGTIQNQRTGETLRGAPMPELLVEIMASGGLYNRLKAGGYLE